MKKIKSELTKKEKELCGYGEYAIMAIKLGEYGKAINILNDMLILKGKIKEGILKRDNK